MKKTLYYLKQLKQKGEKITWAVTYDFWTSRAAQEAGCEMLLCGDSLANTVLGYESTNCVNTDDVMLFNKAVRRGAPDVFLVGDLTSGSYEQSNEQAVETAFRFVKESSVDAVKFEGDKRISNRIKAVTDAGIPVIFHAGLTPQRLASLGGYRVQGKTLDSFENLVEDVESTIWAGAFAVLVEGVPSEVGEQITKRFGEKIITFGIGGGPHFNGQLLLNADLTGSVGNLRPTFAKNYIPGAMHDLMVDLAKVAPEDLQKYGKETRMDGFYALNYYAIKQYVREVKESIFPGPSYCYQLKPEELALLKTSKYWLE